MDSFEQPSKELSVTSRLIDLIILMPEAEQLQLLRQLEAQHLPPGRKTAGEDEYAGPRYFYWDLFK
jgi:hypothetical protein